MEEEDTVSSRIPPAEGEAPRLPKNDFAVPRSCSSGDEGSGVRGAKTLTWMSRASSGEVSMPCRLTGLLGLGWFEGGAWGWSDGRLMSRFGVCCGISAARRSISWKTEPCLVLSVHEGCGAVT